MEGQWDNDDLFPVSATIVSDVCLGAWIAGNRNPASEKNPRTKSFAGIDGAIIHTVRTN